MKINNFKKFYKSGISVVSLLISVSCASVAMERENSFLTPASLGLSMSDIKLKEILDFKKDIKTSFGVYKTQGQDVLNSSENQDIFVTLGNTGAGKSTLLNLLVGNPLKATSAGYVLEEGISNNFFKIGSKGSETLIPKFLKSDSFLLFDLPGFEDTRGTGVAFINGMCIKNILTKAKSVRFLFVEGKGSFETQRGESFKTLMGRVSTLFNSEMLKTSSLLVVSQSDTFDTESLINEFILKKIEEPLSVKLKQIFSLKEPYSVVPFVHPNFFIKEDRKTKKKTLNEGELREALNDIRKDLQDAMHRLKGVKIPEINQSALLNRGTDDLVSGLLKVISAETWNNIVPSLEGLDLNGLNQIKKDLNKNIRESFQKRINLIPELNFIKLYDLTLYNNHLKESESDLSEKIRVLETVLDKKMAEKAVQAVKEETLRLEATYKEKIAQAAEKEKIRLKAIHEEEKLQLQATYKEKELEREAIRKEEAEKAKQKAEALEREENKRMYADIIKEVNTYNTKKQKMEEYITERENSNWWMDTVKGISSLGLHTAAHWNGREEEEGKLRAFKNTIKSMLHQYKLLTKGEKHPFHDEF